MQFIRVVLAGIEACRMFSYDAHARLPQLFNDAIGRFIGVTLNLLDGDG
jgi:hypothetical protein